MPRVQYKSHPEIPLQKEQQKKIMEAKLANLFMKHDYDGNKVLNRNELKGAFNELRSCIPGFRADRAMRFADGDGNGVIDESEMIEIINYAMSRGFKVV